MAQYIDKDALIAEIEKRQKEEVFYDEDGSFASWADQNHYSTLVSIKNFINTFEVKEVDLEKEIDNYLQPLAAWEIQEAPFTSMENIAKHFFELGVWVNNPITAADRGTAEEIIINLKRVENDYRINLTKEIEWLRNKVKKGEEI